MFRMTGLNYHEKAGDQTYKHFFSFTLSNVPYYLHIFTMTWAERKNVGIFIN